MSAAEVVQQVDGMVDRLHLRVEELEEQVEAERDRVATLERGGGARRAEMAGHVLSVLALAERAAEIVRHTGHLRAEALSSTARPRVVPAPTVLAAPALAPAPAPAQPVPATTIPGAVEPEPKSTAVPVPSADKMRRAIGAGLLLLAGVVACFFVFLFLLSGLTHDRNQRDLRRQLRDALATGSAPTGAPIVEGRPMALLEISRLDLAEVIVEGTDSGELKKGPGHLRSSPLPGQEGNAVVMGRRSLYGAPFRSLKKLRSGDEIRVTTAQGEAIYEVTGARRLRSGRRDQLGPTGDNRLTLLTSDPAMFPSGRLALTAELLTDPQPVPGPLPNVLPADEDGLHGETTVGAALLAWLLLLVGAVTGTTMLYLRWAKWPTWVITTPVLAALLYLVFDSFDRLLPATL